jgi:CubicO group peptidase (beta-lactamase class C family)
MFESSHGHGCGHESGLFGRTRAIKPDPAEYGDPPFGSPGGFLYCTIADLLRFVDFHIQGANGNGKLLSRDSFTRLHTPQEKQQYALGWEVEIERDGQGKILNRSIYHGGFSGRFRANMWFSPESRAGTVIVYNYGGDDAADAYADVFYALLEEFGLWKKESRWARIKSNRTLKSGLSPDGAPNPLDAARPSAGNRRVEINLAELHRPLGRHRRGDPGDLSGRARG